MSRPAVSVVMPFAGSRAEGEAALAALLALTRGPDDELILTDNSGVVSPCDGLVVVAATGEHSPSHARNVGAEHATRGWILFLDADCVADPDLLDRYFSVPVADDVGALAGEVASVSAEEGTLAARYGAARGWLGLGVHLAHPYLPRAAAANLLVRRRAFELVGGFYEGVRAAEDTDFSWRLQRSGWRLEARPQARVRHRYRTSLEALRRQWRGYAAGRAWLSRRYEDFEPEPALRRAAGRVLRHGGGSPAAPRRSLPPAASVSRRDRGAFLALDALLGFEELAGFALSNRPRSAGSGAAAEVVLVVDRFPSRGDPLADYARTLCGARVEAAARPEAFDPRTGRELSIAYREDDGAAARLAALLGVLVRHPLRAGRDRLGRSPDEPSLAALAPAALRLAADRDARVHALGGGSAPAVARRLAALSGHPLLQDHG
ncbi:MAG: glycosyltransferase family 2 protein [Solirubrobacteraceae bacterium]